MDKLIHKQIDRQTDGSRKSQRVRKMAEQIGSVKEKGGEERLIVSLMNAIITF